MMVCLCGSCCFEVVICVYLFVVVIALLKCLCAVAFSVRCFACVTA